ncbi:Ankyrin repeat and zinc finger domain-containing protein 1 [Operophtera brumata]|uniref:Ankyrin repeat and zinc finger domain-containing protein 1 n=1 Tax=Operophtera brumata TaxID=104452 RepID=A0A0L7LLG5_OPEBR|nr:Ankyrin repeat and zinc finger domain-containing protein 1 [Operophtera brumata]
MSSQTAPIKPKSLKVYYHDDFARITTGLRIASCMIAESYNIVDEQSVLKRLSALTLNGPSDGNTCSCCGIGPFESRQQQIAHYKNHWHTHNLKRKLFGKTALTMGQFNSRIGKL